MGHGLGLTAFGSTLLQLPPAILLAVSSGCPEVAPLLAVALCSQVGSEYTAEYSANTAADLCGHSVLALDVCISVHDLWAWGYPQLKPLGTSGLGSHRGG